MKVIRVENLGKCYTLRHQGQGHSGDGLRHALQDAIAAPFRRLRRPATPASSRQSPDSEEFWALKDVSFTVNEGEVVGIIGRNGAGKSTLLKILSRITEPTSGRIGLKGRVASLLEVGTGFHPELTGRENIFLNGAILGMSRAEVARKFDEIVDFSGVEKFLDTPVKRYSSGMYVRLAFAVAAHLEPEILIVDEVLAVGDAGFQAKCLGKMQDVAGGGRTVLFVSHQMSAIQRLCSRVIWMERGMMAGDGFPAGIIERYTREAVPHTAGIPLRQRKDRRGRGLFRFTGVEMQNSDGVGAPVTGAPLSIRLEIVPTEAGLVGRGARVSIAFTNSGDTLFVCSSELCFKEELTLRGPMFAVCKIPRFPLGHGRYEITLYLEALGEPQDWIEGGTIVTVEAGDFFGSGRNAPHGHEGRNVLVDHVWHVEENASITA